MVINTNLSNEIIDLLESRIRKKILHILATDGEKSAYYITQHKDIDVAISTVVEHLQKLEKAGLVEIKDTSKGKLIRHHYNITKKGKKILKEYYNNIFEDIHKYISVDPLISPFNIVRITKILNCIYSEELSDIGEISKRTGFDEGLVHRYISDLKKAKIILERPIRKNSKKGFHQVDFSKTILFIRFDEDDLNRLIDHYKNANNEIMDAEKLFVKNKKRIAELSARVKPFKVRDPPIHDEACDELEKLVIKKKKK